MAILIGFILTYLLKICFPRFGTGKKSLDAASRWNSETKPTVGGIVFYAAFVLVLGITLRDSSPVSFSGYVALAIAGTVAFLTGLWDDVARISPGKKLAGQLLTAAILVAGGLRYSVFDAFVPGVTGTMIDVLLTIFFVVGFMNSVNMMDNMDGVATVSAIPLIVLAVVFRDDSYTNHLAMCIGGALCGFLVLNWYPSKVFMGDSGAMLLGFIAAYLPVHVSAGLPGTEHYPFYIEIAFVLCACPLFMADTILVIIQRLRNGVSPMQGGRDHMSHQLYYLGWSHHRIIIFFAVLGIVQVAFGFYLVDPLDLFPPKQIGFLTLLPAVVYFLLLFAVMFRISTRNLRTGKFSYRNK